MPHEEEELDVNEFKSSNQITKGTRVLPLLQKWSAVH